MDIKTENWTITEDDGGECLDLGTDEGGFPVVNMGTWASREQMVLAAAAPDLARVLLAVEWSAQLDGWVVCPSCRAQRGFSSEFSGKVHELAKSPHNSNCALEAALKKAGLR